MLTKYICILVIGWPRPKQLAKNLLILKTFNCFAALRRLREFDAKQPFNEEETRGMFYCFFSNLHPIQKKGFPKTAYRLNNCIFQLYTAWRSTILDDYTTKTKDQVSRMSRGFLSYFTKTRENALNRPVYRAQGTVLQIIWTILIFFWKSAIFFHAFRSSKILGKGGEVSILWKQHPLVLGPFGSWINPVNWCQSAITIDIPEDRNYRLLVIFVNQHLFFREFESFRFFSRPLW